MLGVLFPGQGSQHIGMGRFLYDNFKLAKEHFEEASDTLSVDFKKLCFNGDEKDLSLTHNTQPALLLTSVASYRILQDSLGLNPAGGAGHSVGEYAATVCSGALEFTAALKLVRWRGELMQEAVPVGEGGMLAVIGLDESEVNQLCAWATKESGLSPLEPANFNSPAQIVVSGAAPLIEWTRKNFTPEKISSQKAKVRMIPLKVSAPFHCSMMQKAQDGMAKALQDTPFTSAQWPIAQNVTGELYDQGDSLRKNLVEQITGAVRWTHCVQTLRAKGIETMVECGPGKVLTGLLKKIDQQEFPAFNLNSLDDIKLLEQNLKA